MGTPSDVVTPEIQTQAKAWFAEVMSDDKISPDRWFSFKRWFTEDRAHRIAFLGINRLPRRPDSGAGAYPSRPADPGHGNGLGICSPGGSKQHDRDGTDSH